MNDAVGAEPLIRLDGVKKVYGSGNQQVHAVNGVSLSIYPGEFVALVGPSGSGKSTLLSLMGTLDHPTAGSVWMGGRSVADLNHRELSDLRYALIGLVFQSFYLLPALSAVDNVALPLIPRRTDFNRQQRAIEMLDRVGLRERARALPSELSGGEQQRVCIARALIADPKVILADEPTGNLDRHNSWQVFEILKQLAHQHNVAVVMATHNLEMAEKTDRLIQLADGVIVRDGI